MLCFLENSRDWATKEFEYSPESGVMAVEREHLTREQEYRPLLGGSRAIIGKCATFLNRKVEHRLQNPYKGNKLNSTSEILFSRPQLRFQFEPPSSGMAGSRSLFLGVSAV